MKLSELLDKFERVEYSENIGELWRELTKGTQ